MVHRCGRKPSGEEVSASLLYSRTMDRLNRGGRQAAGGFVFSREEELFHYLYVRQ